MQYLSTKQQVLIDDQPDSTLDQSSITLVQRCSKLGSGRPTHSISERMTCSESEQKKGTKSGNIAKPPPLDTKSTLVLLLACAHKIRWIQQAGWPTHFNGSQIRWTSQCSRYHSAFWISSGIQKFCHLFCLMSHWWRPHPKCMDNQRQHKYIW